MFWTILALSMTVFMGGIIAYNGDLIGRKYGKRRVTMFGLRPKHTAILITSVTGVLISGLTTVAMFLLVPQVRRVILEGEAAIRANPQLRSEKSALESSNRSLEQRNSAERALVAATEGKLRVNLGESKLVQQNLRIAKIAAQSAQDRRKAAEGAIALLQTQAVKLRRNNSDLNKANKELAQANIWLDEKNHQMGQDAKILAAEIRTKSNQNREYSQANEEISRHNEALIRENSKLEDTQTSLKGAVAGLTDLIHNLDAQTAALTEQNSKLSEQNRKLSDQNTQLASQTDRVSTSRQAIYQMYEDMRRKRVVVQGGDDLARTVIPANAPVDSVHKALMQLMHQAHEAALARGSRPNEESSPRAVRVVNKEYLVNTPFGPHPAQITEDDRIDAMSHRLAMSEAPVCVLALAVANSLENEPAEIDFQPFKDHLIYIKGKKIASRRINASQPTEDLFLDLMAYLKDVGESARERGMIPRIDPATGSPEVGSLNWPELVRLVEHVRGHHGFVKVTALASADTNASDPLKMDFKVEADL